MPRSRGQGIIPLDPEIERTLRSLRKINRNLSSEFTMTDDPPAPRETLTFYKPRTGNNLGMKGSNRRMNLEPFETT